MSTRVKNATTRTRPIENNDLEHRKGKPLKKTKTIGDRIREAREEKGMTQEDLAKATTHNLETFSGNPDTTKKRGRTSVTHWETGRAYPEYETILAIARAVNKPPEYLAYGITPEPRKVFPDADELGYVLSPELIVTGKDTSEHVTMWGLPLDWLRNEIGVASHDSVFVYRVETDVDKFGYGDRVIVDRSNTKPSPPGHFLYWDGVGVAIARLTIIPGAGRKPTVKVENPAETYMSDLDKMTIIGKIRGVFQRA